MIELMEDLLEHFKNEMDCDYNYESGRYVPDESMKFFTRIEQALNQMKKATVVAVAPE